MKNFQLILKLIISVGIFAVVFTRLDVDELKNIVTEVNPLYWVFAVCLTLAQFFLLSLRWEILINIGVKRMSYVQSLQTTLIALLANTLFIATIGGMAVKIALSLKYGASIFKAIFATIIDRFMTLFALAFFAALTLPGLTVFMTNETYIKAAMVLSILGFALLVFTPLILLLGMELLSKIDNVKLKTHSAFRYLKFFINNQKMLIKVMAISLLAQIMYFLAIYILSHSTGIELSFLQLMTVLPIISLISSLPVSIGGWGVREGSFVYGFAILGVSQELGF
ncbi:MAG: lysylphosphatidylglycerol synthase transmembrane domain-containing protein, partial [Pseudomonadota bacterium]